MHPTSDTERQRAIKRGLQFIYQFACDAENFEAYGFDLLGCFDCIQSTSKDPNLVRAARRMGRERARCWRREYARLTPDLPAEEIACLVFGSGAADRLGIRDDAFKNDLCLAAQRFNAVDYLGFDPVIEPPPDDLPDECSCNATNKRGRRRCHICKRTLWIMSRWAIWVDALTRSYHGERYAIILGAPFADVIKWLPSVRPYPSYDSDDETDLYWAIYGVTHVVYTLNDYSLYKLSARHLPDEYAFLKRNLKHFVEMEDAETIGELLDSLKAFAVSSDEALIRQGEKFLLANQNADGSWGDLATTDVYQRYHPTRTALDGLREHAWWGGRRSRRQLPKVLR